MKTAVVRLPASLDSLTFEERPEPAIEPGMVKVRWHALSLNFHDFAVASGKLPTIDGRIPMSDGAGEILEVGAGVTRWKPGDRVISLFFPDWYDGAPTAEKATRMGGDSADGCASQISLVDPERLTAFPEHYSYAEASTLPCAALTAWRAVIEECRIKPGDRVLVEGTGGMSLFVLQFARMAGATVYATSSSDDKCERLRRLGAAETVNYRHDKQWGETVFKLASGGVDHVVDVGGGSTIAQSLSAVKVGGNVILVGVLGGLTAEINLRHLIAKQPTIKTIAVGSRKMQEDMVKAIAGNGLKPVIDSSFAFSNLADAFRHQISGQHVGKIVIDMSA